MVTVLLNSQEIACLDRQDPATKRNGGFQGLMVSLQERVDRTTGTLTLTLRDLERIQRYASKYGNGGWEGRLETIFLRTLGPTLGRQYLSTAA